MRNLGDVAAGGGLDQELPSAADVVDHRRARHEIGRGDHLPAAVVLVRLVLEAQAQAERPAFSEVDAILSEQRDMGRSRSDRGLDRNEDPLELRAGEAPDGARVVAAPEVAMEVAG